MDVVIKKSKINNKGVFAKRSFKKGEVVLRWNPVKLTNSDAKKLSEGEKHYLYYENEVAYLMQSPERFVNHSCDANTKPINLGDVAIRGIAKGEEITSNYGGDSSVAFVCKCGSNKCVGFVRSK